MGAFLKQIQLTGLMFKSNLSCNHIFYTNIRARRLTENSWERACHHRTRTFINTVHLGTWPVHVHLARDDQKVMLIVLMTETDHNPKWWLWGPCTLMSLHRSFSLALWTYMCFRIACSSPRANLSYFLSLTPWHSLVEENVWRSLLWAWS